MTDSVLAGRIRAARGAATQADFAVKAGLSRQSIVNYEAGKTIPSAVALKKIALASGCNISWLLGGPDDYPDNAFFLPPADTSLPPIPILSSAQAGDIGQEPLQINRLPVEYQNALKVSDQYWEGDGEYWLTRPADVKSISAYSVRIEGDSMTPMIKAGDFVLASPVKRVFSGDLAVVKVKDDALLVKMVQFRGSKIILQSHNPHFEEMEFPAEQITFCHKVVWVKVS